MQARHIGVDLAGILEDARHG